MNLDSFDLLEVSPMGPVYGLLLDGPTFQYHHRNVCFCVQFKGLHGRYEPLVSFYDVDTRKVYKPTHARRSLPLSSYEYICLTPKHVASNIKDILIYYSIIEDEPVAYSFLPSFPIYRLHSSVLEQIHAVLNPEQLKQ